ncbi:MAG TPA: DUF721 domain-containing protein [Burkholderiales bacterium]|nr:DUF721 domain-containing protein [Burkholderiales bacterium]
MISRLRDLLAPALARSGLDASSDLWRIADAWERAVGPTIAAHAAPAGFQRGELAVASNEAVWRQELTYLASDIKEKINRILGGDVVARIRIVAGPPIGPRSSRLSRTGAPPAFGALDDPALAPAAVVAPTGAGEEDAASDGGRRPHPPSLGEALSALERARAARLDHEVKAALARRDAASSGARGSARVPHGRRPR